jgi:4'-phosphopantetheinyl transferase
MTGVPTNAVLLTPLVVSLEAQVWSASLDQSDSCVERLTALLAPDEIDRATRLVHEAHRRRFIAGRGMLRMLLSDQVGLAPARIRFTYRARGKPELAGPASGADIRFNVSHSQDRVVYAVARGRRVGVDIEHVRPVSNMPAIARRFFTASENVALQALPEDARLAAFFRCWTRKETLVKARGEGVSEYLRRVDVPVAPGPAARPLTIDGWALEDFCVGAGVVAAVAVEADA